MVALCKAPTKSAGIGLPITAVCKNAGKKTLGQDDFFVVCRSDLLLGSRNLSRNRNKLTNPLGLGTLLNKNRRGWTNWNINKSPMFSNKSRGHGLNHDIHLIKKAPYGHAHSSRKFPTRGVINKKIKKKEKEGRGQGLIQKE